MSKTTDLVETLTGHWGQGEFMAEGRDEHGDVVETTYCVLGAAGQAWHDEPMWFENFDDWVVTDLRDQVEHVDQVEQDWEWAKGFADYLCEEYADLLAMDFPFTSERSTLDGYRAGALNPFTVIIRWNDGIANDEHEVIDALRGYERSTA